MQYDVPIFDPYLNRGSGYYHPANEEALLLLHVQHTFRDVVILLQLIARIDDKHQRGLLTKYAIVELWSLDTHVRRLANMVIRAETEFVVSADAIDQVKVLYSRYVRAWRPHRQIFYDVRRKLGAHRDPLPLTVVGELWDSIDIATVLQIVHQVPPIHDFLKDLDLLKWTKSEMTADGEVIAFIQPFDGPTLSIPRREGS